MDTAKPRQSPRAGLDKEAGPGFFGLRRMTVRRSKAGPSGPLPGGREPGNAQRGEKGFFLKKKAENPAFLLYTSQKKW